MRLRCQCGAEWEGDPDREAEHLQTWEARHAHEAPRPTKPGPGPSTPDRLVRYGSMIGRLISEDDGTATVFLGGGYARALVEGPTDIGTSLAHVNGDPALQPRPNGELRSGELLAGYALEEVRRSAVIGVRLGEVGRGGGEVKLPASACEALAWAVSEGGL